VSGLLEGKSEVDFALFVIKIKAVICVAFLVHGLATAGLPIVTNHDL